MAIYLNDDVTYEIAPSSHSTCDAYRGAGEPRGVVLPFYLLADKSGSMDRVIGEVNTGLSGTLDALESHPMTASKVRFSVIGFNNQADVVLPMSDLREVEAMEELVASGGTSYAAAFRLLKSIIEADVRSLKEQGYMVHRPAVFFLSDGVPTDSIYEWETALAELTSSSFPAHPNIIAFGMGDADERVIAKVATKDGFAFRHAGSSDLGQAVADFMEALTRSIIASGSAVAQGQPLQIPKPAGFLTIEPDVI